MMYGADAASSVQRMVADAERAVSLDPRDAEAVGTLGIARLMQGRHAEAEVQLRAAVALSPANSHVLVMAAGGLTGVGKAQEVAELADRALQLDPRMVPANITGVKDAYYLARRYEDTIRAVSLSPEESRSRDSWLFLAGSYARSGGAEEAARAKAELLLAFPSVSAERMLNEDYTFARKEDEDFFVETFTILGLPTCMTAAEVGQAAVAHPLPAC